jgi:hypothetical protein
MLEHIHIKIEAGLKRRAEKASEQLELRTCRPSSVWRSPRRSTRSSGHHPCRFFDSNEDALADMSALREIRVA